ncbi:hypothetical protein LJR030_004203 [Rhizobium sp. LjRoot30]|uniref:hypothetical protein n=1 Tax=Rhizobium sp. LjRoot30 TaxID=3342320 RepID=UPI003ED05BD0
MRVKALLLLGILGGIAAPVLAEELGPFDEPVSEETLELPASDLNPDAKPQVACSRFAAFAVKEVDIGEVGAEKLSLMAPTDACTVDTPGEKIVKDDAAGYFLGVSGDYVFFQAPDGWNGGLPFVVYDRRTAGRLFDDAFAGDGFTEIKAAADTLMLRYRRSMTTECSLYKDTGSCAAAIAAKTGLTAKRIPDCTAVYEAEKKRTPDFTSEIEKLPTVINYPVEMQWTSGKATFSPMDGDVTCNLPS